jgi:hypothetical protein
MGMDPVQRKDSRTSCHCCARSTVTFLLYQIRPALLRLSRRSACSNKSVSVTVHFDGSVLRTFGGSVGLAAMGAYIWSSILADELQRRRNRRALPRGNLMPPLAPPGTRALALARARLLVGGYLHGVSETGAGGEGGDQAHRVAWAARLHKALGSGAMGSGAEVPAAVILIGGKALTWPPATDWSLARCGRSSCASPGFGLGAALDCN